MKISIIGANSYIARNMILTIENYNPTFELALYDCSNEHVDGRTNYKKINILDSESVKDIDMHRDLIYMFVGKTGSVNGFDEFNTFIDINERALLNILNEYRRQKATAKIIFPSTRLVYKGASGVLKENAEKEFKTIYAINKFACETYLKQYNNVYGVNYCIFRICVPYGTLIPNVSSYGTAEFMLSKATNGDNIVLYGDGAVRRTLTYMGDLCDALLIGGLSEKCMNDVYNIGGEDYSLKEMAQLIARKYGVGVDFVEWPEVSLQIESGNTVFDDSKLKDAISNSYKMRFADWIG